MAAEVLTILDTGISSAKENMECDEELLRELDPTGPPVLHLYQWERPAATYGYFIAPEKHLDLEKAKHYSLDLARRPTGGGIVFHIWDLAFSFLMPCKHPAFSLNTLENYQFVNRAVLEVVTQFLSLKDSPEILAESAKAKTDACQHFCMAKPTQYDVVHQGRKIAGAAQRRRKQGYLHQGTISLAFPQIELLKEVLRSKRGVLEAMLIYTFAPLGRIWEPNTLREAREEIQKLLAQKLMEKLAPFQ